MRSPVLSSENYGGDLEIVLFNFVTGNGIGVAYREKILQNAYRYGSKILQNAEDITDLHRGKTILTFHNSHYDLLLDPIRIDQTNQILELMESEYQSSKGMLNFFLEFNTSITLSRFSIYIILFHLYLYFISISRWLTIC
jgi:hypothetical protein